MRLVAICILVVAGAAQADDAAVSLTLKDHKFTPVDVTLPANIRARITVKNLDATPAEFESNDFSAEKVIPGGGEVVVAIPALKPGIYEFHDEYHEDASKSRLVVK